MRGILIMPIKEFKGVSPVLKHIKNLVNGTTWKPRAYWNLLDLLVCL